MYKNSIFFEEYGKFMKKETKKAFTLAEIMIALVVIGVITSILLPVAFNSVPDENVMKFKKGNATLAKVINELVSSEKYYSNGDLGTKADGTRTEDSAYLCNTFCDIVSSKKSKCEEMELKYNVGFASEDWEVNNALGEDFKLGEYLDKSCKEATLKNYVVTTDDITYYETNPENPFGINEVGNESYNPYYYVWNKLGHYDNKDVTPEEREEADKKYYKSGFYYIYKMFCMDIDGIKEGEDPFGYGIRVDGKIVLGERAQEWLEKSIQDKD